ncbi:MAG: DMT family transporter [Pseudomonadota bacterium]
MRDIPGPLPALVVLTAFFALAGMDAVIKYLTDSFHVGHIVAFRYWFGALVALPFFLAARGPRFSAEILGQSSIRAILVTMAAYCFFYALSIIPLAEATALAFTAPLFVVLFARLILKEPIPSVAVISVGIGLAGVLVMIWDDLGNDDGLSGELLGAGLVLAAALGYSLVMVLTRLHSVRAAPAVMVFSQTIVAAFITLPLLFMTWQLMDTRELALFALVGVLGSTAHLGLAWAFSSANAARLSPLEYSVLPWAVVFGYLFFAEIPEVDTLIGAVMIVAACLLVVYWQARSMRSAKQSA